MNHEFIHDFTESQLDRKACAHCRFNYLQHSEHASCEACGKIGKCIIFGAPRDSRSMLLCPVCYKKEWEAEERLRESTRQAREEEQKQSALEHEVIVLGAQISNETKSLIIRADQVIKEAKDIDAGIKWNGDFFNVEMKAISEVKSAIFSDPSIESDKKQFKFQEYLIEHYRALQSTITELDINKHRAVSEQLAIKKTLSDLGAELRAEIREEIKQADKQYQPQVIPKPKVNKTIASKSPLDRLIEQAVIAKNGNRKAALEALVQAKLISEEEMYRRL